MRRGLLIATLLSTLALSAQTIPGPANARVVCVYEGDTFTVDAVA